MKTQTNKSLRVLTTRARKLKREVMLRARQLKYRSFLDLKEEDPYLQYWVIFGGMLMRVGVKITYKPSRV